MPERAIFQAVDRQAGALVGVPGSQFFVNVDAMARGFTRGEMAVLKAIGMGDLTVAGLSKQNGITYMKELAGGDNEKVFEQFTDALYIPADRTGKMTHTYIDEELILNVTDYMGVAVKVITMSAIHLEACDFTLSVAIQYKEFLQRLSEGYIFKGVTYA